MHGPSAISLPAPSSDARRWRLLALLSLAMFGNYYVYDAVAPVADLLVAERGFSQTQIGMLNAVYSLPNIAMVFVGGLVTDRIGARAAAALFAAICAVGAVVTAACDGFGGVVLGRLLFGLGAESMIVAVTTAIGHAFAARALGLALGLNLSLARAGSYAADLSPGWASGLYERGSHAPLWLAAAFAALCLVAALLAWRTGPRRGAVASTSAHAPFVLRDALRFPTSFWCLVGLCTAIYSVLLPYRSTFAIQFLQDAKGLSRAAAGSLNGAVFLAAIFATPVLGGLFDRPRRRTAALLAGSVLLLPVFPLLAWTDVDPWWSNVLLGVAYSLVPAVLWPCVAHLVAHDRLGTAYGVMTMIQNAGLALGNLVAGGLNDAFGAGREHPDGYRPMLVLFAVLSLCAVACATVLRRIGREADA